MSFVYYFSASIINKYHMDSLLQLVHYSPINETEKCQEYIIDVYIARTRNYIEFKLPLFWHHFLDLNPYDSFPKFKRIVLKQEYCNFK